MFLNCLRTSTKTMCVFDSVKFNFIFIDIRHFESEQASIVVKEYI